MNNFNNIIPEDFKITKKNDLFFENETRIIESKINESSSGKVARMMRGYNKSKKEYYMLDSHFDEGISKWIKDVPISLVKDKGIPLTLYLDLRAMKLLEIPFGEINYFIIYNIHEWESLFDLTHMLKNNKNEKLNLLIQNTKIFQSRKNVIIQSGYTVEDIKIDVSDSIFSHPNSLISNGLSEEKLKLLSERYDINISDMIFWNFSIIIKVKKIY